MNKHPYDNISGKAPSVVILKPYDTMYKLKVDALSSTFVTMKKYDVIYKLKFTADDEATLQSETLYDVNHTSSLTAVLMKTYNTLCMLRSKLNDVSTNIHTH